jgi:hypothetical protein
MAEPPRLPVMPEFATIMMWRELSGMSRSKTYEELGVGHLRGVKCGRVVLIDVRHGLEWLHSLPPAEIRPRTTPRRRGMPSGDPITPEMAARAVHAGAVTQATEQPAKRRKKRAKAQT